VQIAKETYRRFLTEEFEIRCKRNSSYSLRAFARDLELSHSSLSRVMNSTQGLSATKAKQLTVLLKLNADESAYFVSLVETECARSPAAREVAKQKLKEITPVSALSLEHFKTISDWHHFAIIELTGVNDFQSNASWIAKRLGIPLKEAKSALDRLFALNMIEIDADGRYQKVIAFQATPSGIPSRSLKKRHQQILKKAETALFEQSVDEREFASITFSMNSETLGWAKEEMKKFRRSLARRLTEQPNKDRLYELSMQLFALDVKKGKSP
jgi:uncharacterized protein (TIGR02147 family)